MLRMSYVCVCGTHSKEPKLIFDWIEPTNTCKSSICTTVWIWITNCIIYILHRYNRTTRIYVCTCSVHNYKLFLENLWSQRCVPSSTLHHFFVLKETLSFDRKIKIKCKTPRDDTEYTELQHVQRITEPNLTTTDWITPVYWMPHQTFPNHLGTIANV